MSIMCLNGKIIRGHIVTPFFNSSIWGNIGKSLSDKLKKNYKNRAARIVTFSDYEIRSSDLLDGLGWERLENSWLYKALSPLHLKSKSLTTSRLLMHIILETLNQITGTMYFIPRPRNEYAKGNLHFRGFAL